MRLNNGIEITWLGQSTVRFDFDGHTALVDAWVQSNPACPDRCKTFDKLDSLFITHGHGDHFADALEIIETHQPTVAAIVEIGQYLTGKGFNNILSMNKGGTVEVNGLKATMTHAVHSSSIQEPDGTLIPGGEAAGFIFEFPNGYKVYNAGDTALFADMRLIGEIYKPDLALLPIGDNFTMGPLEAAHALRLLNVKAAAPTHYATFDVLTGTPEAWRAEAERLGLKVQFVEWEPGDTLR